MSVPAPHFLLFSEGVPTQGPAEEAGHWRFVIESADGTTRLEAADLEPQVRGERLELLAVVRGLEALDQPSQVTLVTPSVYVRRGLRFGLEEWRGNNWCWERFGCLVPVKNHDLWKRLDRALNYHQVECTAGRTWRFDGAHGPAALHNCPSPRHAASPGVRAILATWLRRLRRLLMELLPEMASWRRIGAAARAPAYR